MESKLNINKPWWFNLSIPFVLFFLGLIIYLFKSYILNPVVGTVIAFISGLSGIVFGFLDLWNHHEDMKNYEKCTNKEIESRQNIAKNIIIKENLEKKLKAVEKSIIELQELLVNFKNKLEEFRKSKKIGIDIKKINKRTEKELINKIRTEINPALNICNYIYPYLKGKEEAEELPTELNLLYVEFNDIFKAPYPTDVEIKFNKVIRLMPDNIERRAVEYIINFNTYLDKIKEEIITDLRGL
jgi:hypothetical protein